MNSSGKPAPPDAGPGGVATADTIMETQTGRCEPVIQFDKAAQALIGQHLKAMYSEVVQERVPDHLLRLLDELERKERQARQLSPPAIAKL